MGSFYNKGNQAFRSFCNGELVDKSALIAAINKTLYTEQRYTCVTRCRRFGKSMAASMLCAYYDQSCNSSELFENLAIANDASYRTHLNRYPVIYLDITNFTTKYPHDKSIVDHIQEDIKAELLAEYPDICTSSKDDLMDVLVKIVAKTQQSFIMIIDEWDAICREFTPQADAMDTYVNLLRRLFKGGDSKDVFAAVYMTGILPIKKFQTESALNNFWEYTMVDPGQMAPFFGYTQEEVRMLAEKYHADVDELRQWYDGYQIGETPSIYNPYSVMQAIARQKCKSYWQNTGAYESIATYIQMNFDGLKNDIIRMLAGGRCNVDATGFQNDLSIIRTKDDVFTVLIHLGYLAYNANEETCYIPNKEVAQEFANAIKASSWTQIAKIITDSKQLLDDTLKGKEEAVAQALEQAHDENTSILSYNDENSLACTLTIAYLWAKNEYIIHREMPTGKGYADLVMIPRRNVGKPAIIIELKYNQTTETALTQIKAKHYPAKVAEYMKDAPNSDILLVGINYDKATSQMKHHTCKIEHLAK